MAAALGDQRSTASVRHSRRRSSAAWRYSTSRHVRQELGRPHLFWGTSPRAMVGQQCTSKPQQWQWPPLHLVRLLSLHFSPTVSSQLPTNLGCKNKPKQPNCMKNPEGAHWAGWNWWLSFDSFTLAPLQASRNRDKMSVILSAWVPWVIELGGISGYTCYGPHAIHYIANPYDSPPPCLSTVG